MEFIKANFINTTTMITVSNNTGLTSNIFNRDQYYQYYTDSLNSDLFTGTITITFDATTNVSRIALIDTNLKEFDIYYNGATANAFTLVNQATTSSKFTTNSDNNVMLRFATISVNSITIDMKKTQTANQEKVIGLFFVSDLIYTMGQIPNSNGYKPNLVPKQTTHTLSDGGVRLNNVRNKFDLPITLNYLSSSDVTSLRAIYDMGSAFNFAAFTTSTGWTNPVFFEGVWVGAWEFYEYSDDASSSGFSGKIRLKETPS
jgi:hypothetical protein